VTLPTLCPSLLDLTSRVHFMQCDGPSWRATSGGAGQ
jgi:hypothetical protein